MMAGKQAIIGHLIPEQFGGLGTQDFRDEVTDDGLLAGRQPDRPVDQVLLVPALLVRRYLALDEGLDDLAESLVVLLVQASAHVLTVPSTPGRASPRTPGPLPARPAR